MSLNKITAPQDVKTKKSRGPAPTSLKTQSIRFSFNGVVATHKATKYEKGYGHSYRIWIPEEDINDFKAAYMGLELSPGQFSAVQSCLNEFKPQDDDQTVYSVYISNFVANGASGQYIEIKPDSFYNFTVALSFKDDQTEGAPEGSQRCFLNLKKATEAV